MTFKRHSNKECPKISALSYRDRKPHSREGEEQKEWETTALQNICQEAQTHMENAACWKLGWGLQTSSTNQGSASSKTCPDLLF